MKTKTEKDDPVRKLLSNKLCEAIYDFLTERAEEATIVTYQDIADVLELDPRSALINDMLGEISIKTNKKWDFMLSSLVINGNLKRPGSGFYNLAWEIKPIGTVNKYDFLETEQQKAFEHFSTKAKKKARKP